MDKEHLQAPLPRPPRIKTRTYNALVRMGVKTVGEIAHLDLDEVRALRHVGEKTLTDIRAMQEHLGGIVPEPTPTPLARERPESVRAMLFLAEDALTPVMWSMVSERARGTSLRVIGEEHDLTRERVRQLILTAVRIMDGRLVPGFADEAMTSWFGIHRTAAVVERAHPGDASREHEQLLALLLLTGRVWRPVSSDLASSWRQGQHADQVRACDSGLLDLTDGRYTAEHDLHVRVAKTLSWSPSDAMLILAYELDWQFDGVHWSLHEDAWPERYWLSERIRQAGRAISVYEAGEWIEKRRARLGLPTTEGFRRVNRDVGEMPEVLRPQPGEVVHLDALPADTAQALRELGERCVPKVLGQKGAVSVERLLAEVAGDGPRHAGLTAWMLKSILCKHPGITPLRKLRVACASSYVEDGVLLSDRITARLEPAGPEGLSRAELDTALAGELGFSALSIDAELRSNPRFTHIEGRWHLSVVGGVGAVGTEDDEA